MKKIKTINLSALLVASHYEYHRAVYGLITTATPAALHIEQLAPKYLTGLETELDIINRNRNLTNTGLLSDIDVERDAYLSRLFGQIDVCARSPIAAEKAAGAELRRIVAPYRGISANEYTKQTGQIRGLLRDLATDEAVGLVDTINAGAIIQQLRQSNNRFSAAMEQRITTEATRTNTDINTNQQRVVVDDLYREIITIAGAFAVATPTTATDAFVDGLNALIDQYKRVIAGQRPGGSGNEKRRERE